MTDADVVPAATPDADMSVPTDEVGDTNVLTTPGILFPHAKVAPADWLSDYQFGELPLDEAKEGSGAAPSQDGPAATEPSGELPHQR